MNQVQALAIMAAIILGRRNMDEFANREELEKAAKGSLAVAMIIYNHAIDVVTDAEAKAEIRAKAGIR